MKLSNVFILLAFVFANSIGVCELHAQAERLRVAMASISTSQVNLWVPRDIGLFKKHGLDVDLVLISGAPIVNAALLSGEVAIAQGGPAPSIQTNLKGAGTYTGAVISWAGYACCLRMGVSLLSLMLGRVDTA